MYGAILGDMIGAPFEFDRGGKTKDFPLFCKYSRFTDDTVMTIAVAEALMDTLGQSDDAIRAALVASMRKWGRKYPDAGYGGRFYYWLRSDDPQPYGSYGNGSAMRVAAAGWLYDTLEATRHAARLTAEVTHNHPEGVKGAEATTSAIYLARTGKTKEEIRDYIVRAFGYDLSRTCDEIRPAYHHVESCQQTVPEAITAFLEGTDFEDVIRTAVSLGGDCDTLTCIAGSIAEAFYGVPGKMIEVCRSRLSDDILQVVDRFQQVYLKRAIEICNRNRTRLNIFRLLKLLRDSWVWIPCSAILSDADHEAMERMLKDAEKNGGLDSIIGKTLTSQDSIRLVPDILQNGEAFYFPVFTAMEEMGDYGQGLSKVEKRFLEAAALARNNEKHVAGIVINAFSEPFVVPRDLFDLIAQMPSALR